MRFEIKLGLRSLSIPDKVEGGRTIVVRIGLSNFFAAPNPLPHPTLSSVTTIINALESAYEAAQDGNKLATQVQKNAEIAYDNALTELSHYVEDRANADPNNGASIIAAAGMMMKNKPANTKPDFKISNGKISGDVKVAIKASKNTAYVVQSSPDPTPPGTAYVWEQVAVGTKATYLFHGMTAASKVWFRYARVIKGTQGDWSDPMSVVVK